MTDFDPEKLKHKPNEKHTLDEVLKSLQDLIHNDLLKGEAARAQPVPADSAPTADATPVPDTRPAPENSDAPLPAADIPLGTVVQSLEELVHKDLALPDESGQVPMTAPDAVVPAAAPPAPKVPTTGQQTFSFDEPAAPAATEPPAPAPTDFDEFTVDLAPPPDEPVAEEITAAPATASDDLPVLEEIALESHDDNPAAIAARVIARLNAERAARGEPALDAATLEALRALLREEIERHQSER